MPELAATPLCESCGEIIPPWRRPFSCCCDGCDLLSPKQDDLSPVVLPHIVTAPVELSNEEQTPMTQTRELIERLRARTPSRRSYLHGEEGSRLINPDGPEAATRLEQAEKLAVSLREAIELLDDCGISHPSRWEQAIASWNPVEGEEG